MTKILIADDHPIVREGLKRILLETSDMVAVDEAGTSQEVLERVRQNDYDLVLLDISMPDRSGLDVLKELKRTKPDLQILVISIHPEEQYAVRAMRAGAAGYLTKESAPDELMAAVQKVLLGRKYINASLAEKLAFALEVDVEKPPHEILSDREYQVMSMIASGKTVKQIAEELMLSAKTINTYRSRVLRKMRVNSSVELIHYAIKHRLVD